MFKIIKSAAGIWFHVFLNGTSRVHISDFEVIIDAVKNTFVIEAKNGSNVPSKPVDLSLVQVIDESISPNPISYSGAEGLILLLTQKEYPPYQDNTGAGIVTKVWSVKDKVFLVETQQYIDDNFDEAGLGINLRVGWKISTEMAGRTAVGQSTDIPFTVIGAPIGSPNAVLIAHEHDSVVTSDGKKGNSSIGTGTVVSGYNILGSLGSFEKALTSKFGWSNTGVFSDTENGENKNIQPSMVGVWIERTSDLVIYGNGAVVPTGVQSIVAGTGIDVDDTDPLNPVVSATGGGSGLTPQNIKHKWDNTPITVDASFVINRIVSLNDIYTDFVGDVDGTDLTITDAVAGDIYLIDGYTT